MGEYMPAISAESPFIHCAFDKTSTGTPVPSSFSFPDAWREYQDDRYGQSERIDREQSLSEMLDKSGILKVVNVLGPDGNQAVTTVFQLDVEKSLAHSALTASALDRLSFDLPGFTPYAPELESALLQLAQQGVTDCYCIPSKARLHELFADLKLLTETVSLPAGSALVFSWSGKAVISRVGESSNAIYEKIMEI